jgi:hypothetical protein
VIQESSGVWQQVPGSTVDTTRKVVSGYINHLSIFSAFGTPMAAAPDLSAVRVYPVPYKPNGGNPDQGDPSRGIIFDQLPADSTIKIYTITGRLVAELSASAGDSVSWNARNSSGQDAASGGYLAVVSSPGLRSVVKKLLIIR